MTELQCRYCKQQLRDPKDDTHRRSKLSATRDHVYPKCLGGKRKVWCCRHCNSLKADMTPDRWKRFTERFPEYWRTFRTHGDVIRALRQSSPRLPVRARFPRGIVAQPPLCRGLV